MNTCLCFPIFASFIADDKFGLFKTLVSSTCVIYVGILNICHMSNILIASVVCRFYFYHF